MPRPYELMVLVNPELADEMLDTELAHLDGIMTAAGAEITFLKRDTPWGRRRLAYPIGKFRDATYLLYRFSAPPGAVRLIERELQLDERVIRYLFTRFEAQPEEPEQEQPAEEGAAATTEAEETAVEANAPEAEPEPAVVEAAAPVEPE